jgi:hypothetical protein
MEFGLPMLNSGLRRTFRRFPVLGSRAYAGTPPDLLLSHRRRETPVVNGTPCSEVNTNGDLATARGAVAAQYYPCVDGVPFLDLADAQGGRFQSPRPWGSRIPESPPVVASMSRSTLASVRCFRAAGHNSKELGTESKPIEAYRRNAVSGAQGRGPAC